MLNKLLLKCIKKLKSKNPEAVNAVAIKLIPKVKKKLSKLYINLLIWEELLELLYGIDSQMLINYKDMLNVLSLDKDRPDTK